jgi:hypothetical protein
MENSAQDKSSKLDGCGERIDGLTEPRKPSELEIKMTTGTRQLLHGDWLE